VIGDWPENEAEPTELAELVTYVGSAEHKSYPSPVGDPHLRSDATRCDPELGYDVALFTEVLREAVRRRCVSPAFNGRFPRYVWGRLGNRLFEARLINRGLGTYKAYELESIETPRDPDERLDWTE
jgi:hypothetical protein